MIKEKALVLYKNRPALVSAIDNEKLVLFLADKSTVKVREKDAELLHPGPCGPQDLAVNFLEPVEISAKYPAETAGSVTEEEDIYQAWELLSATGEELSLKELSELLYDDFSPKSAVAVWKLLCDNLFFSGNTEKIKARPKTELEAEEKKRKEKLDEARERGDFLGKIKRMSETKTHSQNDVLTETEKRFLQDVEALARGRTDKSRTLRELGKSETPVEAHKLLLASGLWTVWENPHPGRFGLSLNQVKVVPPPPPEEKRLDLTGLKAFAIDNSWSDDPDDAVSLEGPDSDGRSILWVHVADPAASVTPDSLVDIEARNRGATLYIPEGSFRMIAPEALPFFALGRGNSGENSHEMSSGNSNENTSPALSFKITINKNCIIEDIEINLSIVRVTRMTYEEADALIESDGIFSRLYNLAEQNAERRLNTGAVIIEIPDTHIRVTLGENPAVRIEPVPQYKSAGMVRECMILAGEGAAVWAARNRVPVPYISQEAGELPESPPEGLAGAFQIRRGMRPRAVSTKPGVHWGLGLDMYTQATSPLRRYTDLLVHQQIRSFLKGEQPLGEEEILMRISAAEAAAALTVKAERASRSHWLSVYLSDKTGSQWEGIILDRQGSRSVVLIPDLGLEIQIVLKKGEPNDKIKLTCLAIKIPECEFVFSES